MKRAAFLDRDGVINRKAPEGEYITRWEDLQILPGVAQAINSLNKAGFAVIVASNQRCIAKGLMTEAELVSLHERMRAELEAAGAHIDDVFYCPHDIHAACGCRKPAPGMLLDAASKHGVELGQSWMIGDSDKDVKAGIAAGCKTVYIGGENDLASKGADVQASSLLDAVRKLLMRYR